MHGMMFSVQWVICMVSMIAVDVMQLPAGIRATAHWFGHFAHVTRIMLFCQAFLMSGRDTQDNTLEHLCKMAGVVSSVFNINFFQERRAWDNTLYGITLEGLLNYLAALT
jgi:hypothetical protein